MEARLKTKSFAVNTYTGSPFWFSVVPRTVTVPWFGFEREGEIARISLYTFNVSPGRVALGQAISPPMPIMPFAKGRPPVTMRRIAAAAVCQPLAVNPRKMLAWAADSSR